MEGIQEKRLEMRVAFVRVIQLSLGVVVESPLFHSMASVDNNWLSSLLSFHPNSSVCTDPCLQEEKIEPQLSSYASNNFILIVCLTQNLT